MASASALGQLDAPAPESIAPRRWVTDPAKAARDKSPAAGRVGPGKGDELATGLAAGVATANRRTGTPTRYPASGYRIRPSRRFPIHGSAPQATFSRAESAVSRKRCIRPRLQRCASMTTTHNLPRHHVRQSWYAAEPRNADGSCPTQVPTGRLAQCPIRSVAYAGPWTWTLRRPVRQGGQPLLGPPTAALHIGTAGGTLSLAGEGGRSRMRLAGAPTYNPCGAQSFVTTAPAPITQPSPIVMPGRMSARAPIQHPSPTRMGRAQVVDARFSGPPMSWLVVQKVTSGAMAQVRPM